MASSLCALRLRAGSRLQLLQPGPRSRVAPAPTPHHRRTAAPVGCSSSASQQASGGSPQPPERQQQQAQQQQTTAGSSSARVATGSGLVELRFVSSSPATAESEASSGQPQTAGGKALFADRALLWHASPSFACCIDEAMGNGSGGASKQIVIPMPANEEAAVWEPVLRLLRQEDLLPVNWANLPELLRVAHAYDMAAVRSACVVFISLHVKEVSLEAPLESAQNVLHLASLANRYLHMNIIILPTGSTSSGSGGGGGTGVSNSKGGASAAFRVSGTQAYAAAADTHRAGLEPQLLPLVACIPAVMHNALAPLRYYQYQTSQLSQSYHHARPVVDRLREISGHPKYKAIVTEPVRDAVLAALLAGFACETPFIISQ